MKDSERIKAMRLQAQRLQDDGAHNAAQTMRDGADRMEQLTQDAAPPHADAGPEDTYVGLPDGTRVTVKEFGDSPRHRQTFDATRSPVQFPDFKA